MKRLVFVAVVMVVLVSAGTVSADKVVFLGYINDSADNGIHGAQVEITRGIYQWTATTGGVKAGAYATNIVDTVGHQGVYEMRVNGAFLGSREFADDDFFQIKGVWFAVWSVATVGGEYNPIPEFSTIAIPIAAILGMLFFFSRRKRG